MLPWCGSAKHWGHSVLPMLSSSSQVVEATHDVFSSTGSVCLGLIVSASHWEFGDLLKALPSSLVDQL